LEKSIKEKFPKILVLKWADKNHHGSVEPWGYVQSSGFIANPSIIEGTWQKALHESLHKMQPEKFTQIV
jgi:hypothetical protein